MDTLNVKMMHITINQKDNDGEKEEKLYQMPCEDWGEEI